MRSLERALSVGGLSRREVNFSLLDAVNEVCQPAEQRGFQQLESLR
jgi:hypothetical protein